MARKLLGNKPYNYNIDVEDTLKKDWKGMKFDVAVTNSPFQRGNGNNGGPLWPGGNDRTRKKR